MGSTKRSSCPHSMRRRRFPGTSPNPIRFTRILLQLVPVRACGAKQRFTVRTQHGVAPARPAQTASAENNAYSHERHRDEKCGKCYQKYRNHVSIVPRSRAHRIVASGARQILRRRSAQEKKPPCPSPTQARNPFPGPSRSARSHTRQPTRNCR